MIVVVARRDSALTAGRCARGLRRLYSYRSLIGSPGGPGQADRIAREMWLFRTFRGGAPWRLAGLAPVDAAVGRGRGQRQGFSRGARCCGGQACRAANVGFHTKCGRSHIPNDLLWQRLEASKRRLAELEARLADPGKTPDNSNLPPSKGQKPDRPEKAKCAGPRQGSLGHKGGVRPLACHPDRVCPATANPGPTEVKVAVHVLNCMLTLGRPTHVRIAWSQDEVGAVASTPLIRAPRCLKKSVSLLGLDDIHTRPALRF